MSEFFCVRVYISLVLCLNVDKKKSFSMADGCLFVVIAFYFLVPVKMDCHFIMPQFLDQNCVCFDVNLGIVHVFLALKLYYRAFYSFRLQFISDDSDSPFLE